MLEIYSFSALFALPDKRSCGGHLSAVECHSSPLQLWTKYISQKQFITITHLLWNLRNFVECIVNCLISCRKCKPHPARTQRLQWLRFILHFTSFFHYCWCIIHHYNKWKTYTFIQLITLVLFYYWPYFLQLIQPNSTWSIMFLQKFYSLYSCVTL